MFVAGNTRAKGIGTKLLMRGGGGSREGKGQNITLAAYSPEITFSLAWILKEIMRQGRHFEKHGYVRG